MKQYGRRGGRGASLDDREAARKQCTEEAMYGGAYGDPFSFSSPARPARGPSGTSELIDRLRRSGRSLSSREGPASYEGIDSLDERVDGAEEISASPAKRRRDSAARKARKGGRMPLASSSEKLPGVGKARGGSRRRSRSGDAASGGDSWGGKRGGDRRSGRDAKRRRLGERQGGEAGAPGGERGEDGAATGNGEAGARVGARGVCENGGVASEMVGDRARGRGGCASDAGAEDEGWTLRGDVGEGAQTSSQEAIGAGEGRKLSAPAGLLGCSYRWEDARNSLSPGLPHSVGSRGQASTNTAGQGQRNGDGVVASAARRDETPEGQKSGPESGRAGTGRRRTAQEEKADRPSDQSDGTTFRASGVSHKKVALSNGLGEGKGCMKEHGRKPKSGRAAWNGAGRAQQASANGLASSRGSQPTVGEPAATKTVTEVEELGQMLEIQDSAVYALDGLRSGCSKAMQFGSALSLVSLLLKRKGRAALRRSKLVMETLKGLGRLNVQGAPFGWLVSGCAIVGLSQLDSNVGALATKEAACLVSSLLAQDRDFMADFSTSATPQSQPATSDKDLQQAPQVLSTAGFQTSASQPLWGSGRPDSQPSLSQVKKLETLVMESVALKDIPLEERWNPVSLVLSSLASVTSADRTSVMSDALKAALREAGALEALCNIVANYCVYLPAKREPDEGTSLSSCAWRLVLALEVLENLTFPCPENQLRILRCSVPANPKGAEGGKSVLFPTRLLSALKESVRGARISKDFRECVPKALALLMNLSHNCEAGAEALAAAGGLQVASTVVIQELGIPGEALQDMSNMAIMHRSIRDNGLGNVSNLHVSLGLLINLVEHNENNRAMLAGMSVKQDDVCGSSAAVFAVDVHGRGSDAGGLSGQLCGNMVPILCHVVCAMVPQETGSDVSPTAGGGPLEGCAITEQELDERERDGIAAAVRVYVAILLGCLMESKPALQDTIASHFPCGTLKPVVSALEQILAFYTHTGAMMETNRESLLRLLRALNGWQGGSSENGEV
eukprot:evm.model.scf_89.10 EVM.evm.TU.scf_89.10   scf_89:44706-48720(+)